MTGPASTIERATTARTAPSESAPTTFARRRLLLGITGVGASVALSAMWLLVLLSGFVFISPDWTPFGISLGLLDAPVRATVLVLCVFTVHAALLGGVEYIGGAVAVRDKPTRREWALSWARGVAVQAGVVAAATFAAALGASLLGWFGLVGAVAGVGAALLVLQGFVARAIAPLKMSRADAALTEIATSSGVRASLIRVVDAPDEAFVGGWVGIIKPQLWIPSVWTNEAHRSLLGVQLARRRAQFTSGARRRGLWRAAAWPALGVALFAPLLPWAYSEGTLWLALPAVSTLWTFVAVLLLPSVSRPVVYSADAVAASRVGVDAVVKAIRQLDAWQDDEPERTAGVEFIFHPVPSRNNRERALHRRTQAALGGGHQQTRLTLFASLAAGGLLGRVVHCNIGRPSLWAVYPGD